MFDVFRDFETRIGSFVDKVKEERDIFVIVREYKSLRDDLKFLMDYHRDKMDLLRDMADKYYLGLEYRDLIESINVMIKRPVSAICQYMNFYEAWDRFITIIDDIAAEARVGIPFSDDLFSDFEGAIRKVVEKMKRHNCVERKTI
jgi:hypothetical protein